MVLDFLIWGLNMDIGKYVITKDGIPHIFDSFIQHDRDYEAINVVSAGFFYQHKNVYHCHGYSSSLDRNSRDIDSKILTDYFGDNK